MHRDNDRLSSLPFASCLLPLAFDPLDLWTFGPFPLNISPFRRNPPQEQAITSLFYRMDSQWYTRKWVVISLHILFWILLILAPLLLRPTFDNLSVSKSKHDGQNFLLLHGANMLMRMALFYLNANYFIPEFIYKKLNNRYIAALLISLMLMLAVDRIVFQLALTHLGTEK